MRHLFYVSPVILSFALLFLSIGIASAQDILRLDEEKSYVHNLETGSKITYAEFLNSDQIGGDMLEFHIYVSKTGTPILDDYALQLWTNMDNPEWKFGDDIYHSARAFVWKGKEEHEYPFPKVILSGNVPKLIENGKVYVTLIVGTTAAEETLETIVQKLEPSMEFSSTSMLTPTPTIPPVTPMPTMAPDGKLYPILIVSAVTIVLVFVIFTSIRLKHRIGTQKIEEYKAKMHGWEKEGYDVSELKEVLEGKK